MHWLWTVSGFAIARNGNSGNRGYGRCLSRLLASHQICGDRNVYAGGDRPAGRTFRDVVREVMGCKTNEIYAIGKLLFTYCM